MIIGLLAKGLLVAGAIVALLPPDGLVPFLLPLRLMALAACIAALLPRLGQGRAGWLSPLFPLAVSATIFYAVLPALTRSWALTLVEGPSALASWRIFVGSAAEVLILQFALLLCAVDRLMLWRMAKCHPGKALALPSPAIAALWILACVVVGLYLVPMRLVPPPTWIVGWMGTYGAALGSIAVIGLWEDALARKGRRPWLVAGLAVALLSAMASAGVAKIGVFIAGAMLLRLLAEGMSAARFATAVGLLAMVGTLVLLVVDRVRYAPDEPIFDRAVALERTGLVLLHKGVVRQVDTGRCLQGVWEQHGEATLGAAFWRMLPEALVPRILWAEKPSLSNGVEYQTLYCGLPRAEAARSSASITLIGQPLAQGGLYGERLAVVFLAAAAVIGTLLMTGNPIARLAWAAVLPWLIDFDQDYAMYWANAIKTMGILAVVVLGLWLLHWRSCRLSQHDEVVGVRM